MLKPCITKVTMIQRYTEVIGFITKYQLSAQPLTVQIILYLQLFISTVLKKYS